MPRTIDVLQSLLHDPRVGWSVGRPGAIAEFYWDRDEPATRDAHFIVTPRGALRLFPFDRSGARLCAGETLSHAGKTWSQWLSLCLPKDECGTRGATVITPIGADPNALCPASPRAVLFDLGIGGPYFRLCVRAESPALIDALEAAAGGPLLSNDNIMRALLADSPQRVFESKLARIEVAQPIAPPGGESPEGPHTHLLPALMQGDGADPISAPAGWVAQVVAYPAHPARDALGKSKPFDRADHEAFQQLLSAFGDPGHRMVKGAVFDAVRSGASPESIQVDDARRDSVRIALRQLVHLDGESAPLARWRAAYDA